MSRFRDCPARFRDAIPDPRAPYSSHEYVLFTGPSYAGKTHEAANWAHSVLSIEYTATARFTTVAKFLSDLHQSFADEKGPEAVVRPLETCSVLILDDWLSEERQWIDPAVGRIVDLLRARGDNYRQTILTTNAPVEEIKRRLHERAWVRLLESNMGRVITLPRLARDLASPRQAWSLDVPEWIGAAAECLRFQHEPESYESLFRALCPAAQQWVTRKNRHAA